MYVIRIPDPLGKAWFNEIDQVKKAVDIIQTDDLQAIAENIEQSELYAAQ